MSNQICALRHVFRINRSLHSLHQARSFVSSMNPRSAYKDEGTQKVIQSIRKLEQKLETSQKMEQASFAKLTERDIEAIYTDLATTSSIKQQTQPKIGDNYLEKLRVKFLDTRPLQQLPASSATEDLDNSSTSAATINPADIQTTVQPDSTLTSTEGEQIKTSLQDVTIHDFEQLIYVNALAKRPEQAEQALQLMKDHGHIPTVRCYNHLMDAYANVDEVEQVVAVFQRLGENGLSPDVYSYSCLVKVLVQASRLDDAFIVFDKMKTMDTIPTQPIFANLINGCLKSRLLDKAWKTFDEMRLSYYQPDEVTFTMMLHACAKNGEVERALNLFEDMSGLQLYPTDVTFNVLIHACAKRPDYYDEAFSLLHQMEEVHGFRPDLITYNTLLGACARKKDLKCARDIFRHLLQADDMTPDHRSFTNLFWCYANYDPPAINNKNTKPPSPSSVSSSSSSSSSSSPPPPPPSPSPSPSPSSLVVNCADLLIPSNLPTRRSAVVNEATAMFNYMTQQQTPIIEITPSLLTAYLNTHVMQQQANDCVSLYDTLFATHQVSPNANTFKVMLRHCYQTKDAGLAWRIWDDYQVFLEKRALPGSFNELSIMDQKKISLEQQQQQFHEGWTLDQQRSMVLLMASTLARANELHFAVQLLNASFPRGGDMKPLRIKDVQTILNKAVQLEDEELVYQVKQLCSRGPKKSIIPGSTKYRRVNSVM